jgi:hypothetical protein
MGTFLAFQEAAGPGCAIRIALSRAKIAFNLFGDGALDLCHVGIVAPARFVIAEHLDRIAGLAASSNSRGPRSMAPLRPKGIT